MKKQLLLVLAIAGLALASAKSYGIALSQSAMLGTTTLAPGEYRVEVVDQKAIIRSGKKTECEAPVKVENADTKYNATTVRYSVADGKMRIQEIHVGGTNTKLVFSE